MYREQRGGAQFRNLAMAVVLLTLLLLPGLALAQPGVSGSYCIDCHVEWDTLSKDPGYPAPTMEWGIHYSGTNYDGSPGSIPVDVTAGDSFEVDFIYRDIADTVAGEGGVRSILSLPSGWTAGTPSSNQQPISSGWKAVWEGFPWAFMNSGMLDSGSPDGWHVLHASTDFDMGAGQAYDNGASGTPGDRDGVPDEMGSDVLITVPAGTSPGTYTIYVRGVGHIETTKKTERASVTGSFTVTVAAGANNNPNAPTGLAQYKSNGTTLIAEGGYTNETTVRIEADISDPDGFNTVKLQIDLDSNGSSDCESSLVSNPSNNVQVSCSVSNGNAYNWQARTVDNLGATSAWTPYPNAGTDFIVDTVAPTLDPVTISSNNADNSRAKVGDTVTLSFTSSESVSSPSVTIAGQVASVSGGPTNWTASRVMTSGDTSGTVTFTINYSDQAGNSGNQVNSTTNASSVTFDKTAPAVSTTAPANGASGVPVDSNVTINFTENVNCATVDTSSITSDSPGWTLSNCSGSQVVFSTSGQAFNTSYNADVTTAVTDLAGNALSAAYPFSYQTAGAPNAAPNVPADHDQYKNDGTSLIPHGGSTDETTVKIKATVSDSDANDVELQVEIIDNASSYTGTPNFTSGFVTSGNVATVSCTGLLDTVNYKWRARTFDGVDYSAWTVYGGSDPDVSISLPVNAAPDAPVDHDQYKIDATTLISQGGTTNETTVKIKATVSDLDANDVELQVELIDNASSYSGTPNFSSGFVTSGSVATVTCTGLTDTVSYKWRVRTFDGIDYSAWSVYGGSDPDVTIDTSSATNVITDCAGCHDYPPADGPRDGLTGAVVGDHAVHGAYTCDYCHVTPGTETAVDFAHRDGNIQLKDGTIGEAGSGDNGFYSKGATFTQSNTPTTGTCSNINCHNNTETPQWGVGATTCTSCHTEMPPATNAHDSHYAAKGWGSTDNTGTYCSTCHPVDHDGAVEVVGSLGYVASSCSSPGGLGCHNDYTTPVWSGTATCTSCHSAGGGNAADPASGLHDVIPAVSGQQHNESVTGGCIACHSETLTAHTDGTLQDGNGQTAEMGLNSFYTQTADNTGTCATTACHVSNSDAWAHKWDSTADFYTTDITSCDGCHGDWMGSDTSFNSGVDHRNTSGTLTTHGDSYTNYTCGECHVIEATTGNYSYTFGSNDWGAGSNHGNGTIDINSGANYLTTTNLCDACHKTVDGTHNFVDTGWSVTNVGGDAISASCTTCHGGGEISGATEDNLWPDGVRAHAANDEPGRHTKHITDLAQAVYGQTLQQLCDDADSLTKQRTLCEYCHAGDVSDSDHMSATDADVFVDSDSNRHAWPIWDTDKSGGGDINATYTAGSDTCSNIDCHNSQTAAGGTYGWHGTSTSTCTMCHTAGGSNVDPNSGLHTGATPTVSGQKHDETIAGGCVVCHTSLEGRATHINGLATTNGSVAADRTNMGLFGDYSNGGSDNLGTCATSCHSGAGDNGSWARRWDSSIHYDPADGDFVECAGCHGGFAGDWTFGTDNVVGDGSVSHDRNWDGDGNSAEVIGNHPDNTDKCKSCHGFGYAGVYDEATFGAHRDGKITFNDEMGYNASTYTCATYCHSNNTDHNLEDSGWSTTANTVDAPPLACTDCHAGTQPSAGVNADSPHSINTIFASKGVTYSCEDCHGGHGLGATQVPNNAAVGINYGTGGIDLSDPIGSATSEAEICWGCHDVHGVSEWDVNTDTNTASFPNFNFGSLDTSNWVGTWNGSSGTTAVWSSANFLYKQGNILSTHSASANGVSGKDIVDNIRCSYCHDVHDTNVTSGDSSSGKPFLRGSWVGNPYLEDGAPRNDGTSDDADYSAYDVADSFGAVPRGGTNYTAKGGYYIDQNSGHPTNNTAMDSPDKFAGLCRLCHEGTAGTPGDGIWQPEEIDNLNKFGTPSADWVGTNGHGAVIKGGGGSQAANIFTMADRMPSWSAYTGDGIDGGNPVMAYQNARFVDRGAFTNAWGEGIRGKDSNAFQYQPYVDTGTRAYNYQYYSWGATVVVENGTTMEDSGIDTGYHQFTCSKCHNPHASRLPRLMITNCLDTNHNTWDDSLVTGDGSTPNGVGATLSAVNQNAEFSQITSAQNCHRVNDPNDADSLGSGWNTVTPWQEF